jgi:hypothetical protein
LEPKIKVAKVSGFSSSTARVQRKSEAECFLAGGSFRSLQPFQLIARGFLRDPGNNALEDVVRGLADMADQLRRDPATPTGHAAAGTGHER